MLPVTINCILVFTPIKRQALCRHAQDEDTQDRPDQTAFAPTQSDATQHHTSDHNQFKAGGTGVELSGTCLRRENHPADGGAARANHEQDELDEINFDAGNARRRFVTADSINVAPEFCLRQHDQRQDNQYDRQNEGQWHGT